MSTSLPVGRRRRQHTPEFKQGLVAQCLPGVSTSAVALRRNMAKYGACSNIPTFSDRGMKRDLGPGIYLVVFQGRSIEVFQSRIQLGPYCRASGTRPL
jgi:hypothetical protein